MESFEERVSSLRESFSFFLHKVVHLELRYKYLANRYSKKTASIVSLDLIRLQKSKVKMVQNFGEQEMRYSERPEIVLRQLQLDLRAFQEIEDEQDAKKLRKL